MKLIKSLIDDNWNYLFHSNNDKALSVNQILDKELKLEELDSLLKHPICLKCNKNNTHKIYRPEIYEFNSMCKDCDEGFTS